MRAAISYHFKDKVDGKVVYRHVAFTQVSGDEAREVIGFHFPGGDPVRDRILAQIDRTPRESPERVAQHAGMKADDHTVRSSSLTSGVRDTSRDAYSRAKVSGKLTQQQALVMAAFGGEGRTRQELAARTGLGINCVCGRIDELVKAGVVRETERRLCRVTKQNAMELQAT